MKKEVKMTKLDKIKVLSQDAKAIIVKTIENNAGKSVTLTKADSDTIINGYSGKGKGIKIIRIKYAIARCMCNIDEKFAGDGLNKFREEKAFKKISYLDYCFTFDLI